MACTPDDTRSTIIWTAECDRALMEAVTRYADHHAVSISDVIEGALVNFMIASMTPVRPLFCSEHRAAMIVNSSGTAVACPVEEGEPSLVFVPEDVFPIRF